ncbi:MAG: ribosome biogenesis GTP-binding protein YihA/YsxC [Cyanobacteria bacterium]|nr:ribosome biogenesis GTP-binding protein YihA/YsxC [Cyanobacteriota bacterium]
MKVVAEFVTSAAGAEGLPKDGLPELAMVGRSNVGKSSLINALVRKTVARTSAAPGKTRLANFYRVVVEPRPPFYLVDLPGFGYARGGDKAREEFDALAADYFGARVNDPRFRGVFVLVDSRHPGLDSDRRTWNWLDSHGVVRHVVATKVDKLTRSERQRHLGELERLYSGPVTPVSAETGEGLDELWKKIASLTKPTAP